MAKIDLKFIDVHQDGISSKISIVDDLIKITINYEYINKIQSVYLDKSTAIKFAKTLRTEINKIES